ncbi:MAG: SigE family RNA polymerase sigma factor, partial [Thermoactinospora sp.]|nr:SigE family RNA polymerase sigma factor [Thermoactinospora sp.]
LDPYDLVGERIVLMDALARLGPRQRATIFLRFWEGRSAEDTARVMGNESSTVRSQTVRALSSLRATLAGADRTDRTQTSPRPDPDLTQQT